MACSQNVHKNDLSRANIKGPVKSVMAFYYTPFYAKDSTYSEIMKTKPVREEIHYYNKNGYETEQFITINNDSLEEKLISQFNEKDRKMGYLKYKNNRVIEKGTQKYNEKGNLVELVTYDTMMNLLVKHIYEYDTSERMIKWIVSYKNDLYLTVQYTYDEQGYIATMTENHAINDSVEYYEYKRNDKGDEIEIKYAGGSIKDTLSYNYDNTKNWTSKIIYSKGNIKQLYKRTIEYY